MRDHFDLIVFDWDGTLYDSIDWIVACMQRAAAEEHMPAPQPEQVRGVIGLGLREAMTALFPQMEPALQSRITQRYAALYRARPAGPGDLFEGVEHLLQSLRRCGYTLAVATGKSRAGLQAALHATGTAPHFAATRCADETASKPHPRMLYELMAETGATPERTVMVGDSLHDLHMARNAGVAAIGVSCGVLDRAQLLAEAPLACLDHAGELLDWLSVPGSRDESF